LFPKVTNILPVILLTLCIPYQQGAVGSSLELNESNRQYPDTTIIKADSISVKTATLAKVDTSKEGDDLKSHIKYHARDTMIGDLDSDIVYLYGEATLDYEDLHLKADYIKVDMNNKELYAEGSTDSLGQLVGKPEFSQGPQKFKAYTIHYNFDTKKGKIEYVITKEGEGYIHGEVVKKDQYNNFFVRNGAYTTCDLDTPHFALTSRRLKVISNNKIVTGPAFLTIEDVTTPLLIPFGFFPNRQGRSSGVIFPVFGESAERGFYFQHLGYYFGFNDYINTALTTDLYTKGSYTLDAATIYSNRYHYNGNFHVSWASTITGDAELPNPAHTDDFHINWTHNQDAKARPSSTFNASVNAGTSRYYQNTISSANNYLSNTFQSSVNWAKTFPDSPFNLGISATHSQNTITHDMQIHLPDISFGISRITIPRSANSIGEEWYNKIGASLTTRATNFVQTKDSLLFKPETLKNIQNGVIHSIPVSTSIKLFKYFSLAPSVNYTERWYFQSIRERYIHSYVKDSIGNFIGKDSIAVDTLKGFNAVHDYSASAGLSTHIYGMYQFTKGPITAIRHVMNPTVAFTYRPDYGDQNHYGYYKTVQTDSLKHHADYSIFQNGVYGTPANGKFGNISFGLDNNLEMKVRTNSDSGATVKKIKIFESLRIGGNYNLAADSMKLSVFNLSGRTTLFDKVGITFSSTLDPYAYDSSGRDYNRYLLNANNHPFHVPNANASVNFSLAGKVPAADTRKYSKDELSNIKRHPEDYIDFKVPYNLTVGYTYSYSRPGDLSPTVSQSASINGDVNLTPKWKVSFNSWYDFTAHRFTNFGANIYRDLHCWEMRLNWIPFGGQESWSFQINVKSALLQDLKMTKKKDFYDR